MIEWYQPGVGMNDGMQLTADLCDALLHDIKPRPSGEKSEKRGQSPFTGTALRVLRTKGDCPLFSPGFISYRDAFDQYVGLDPHTTDTAALISAVKRLNIQSPESLDREEPRRMARSADGRARAAASGNRPSYVSL